MADKIKKSDLFEDGLLSDINKDGAEFAKTLKDIIGGVEQLMTVTKNKINLFNPKDFKDIQELNKEIKNGEILIEKQLKLKKIDADISIKNEKIKQQQLKTQKDTVALIAAEEKELKRANKEKQNSIKNEQKLNSVYEQNKKALKSVSDRYKELISRGREGTAEGKKLKAEFDRLDKSVRKAEEGVGQFNRNVGNYKAAIKGALSETGLFNSGIGRLVVGLSELKKKFEENSKAGGGFGDKLKLGLAGGVGLAIGALTALASVNSEVAQGLEKLGAKLIGFATNGFEGAKAAVAFKDALFASFKTLREFGLELQKVTLDEEDFRDISNDTTIGFKERNAALEKSIELSKERAKIALSIANLQLDIINKEVASKGGFASADPELLNKQAEAQKKVNEALDVQSDLTRENAQLERQLAIERTSQEIDLLLKQKQNANARKAILEKELADEGVQLEKRKKDALELAQINTKTTNEQIRLFKKGFDVEFNSLELVNEQDAIALKQKIESIQFLDENNKLVGLGVDGQKLLAEIVAKYQKENIEYLELKKKLQEEEIKRTQRLVEINSEIAIAIQADEIKDLEDSYSSLNEKIDVNTSKLLEGENVFSSKLKKELQIQIKLRDEQAQQIFNKQVELLAAEADIKIKSIENSKGDEKIKTAEILKINEQLKIDLENLGVSQTNIEFKNKELDIQIEKDIAKKKLEIALEQGNKVLDIVEQSLEKQSEKRQEFFDKELDQREKNIDKQRELAARGLNNTLAFEEEQKAKLELSREQERVKEAKRQKAIAFLRLVAGYADKDASTAVEKAIADIALAGLIENSFATGVEGLQGEGTETSDSILARLSKNESVITAKATKDNAGLPTAMNEGRVDEYFTNKYLPKVAIDSGISTSTASNIHSSLMLNQLVGVNNRLKSLENAIINKRETHTNIDNVGNVITSDIENGFKKVVTKIRQRPRI